MIVVEGPDGAGKTTLINQLKADLGVEVAPRVVSKDTKAMVNLIDWVHTNLDQGWQPTLFDRHRLISEPIYGPALRDWLEPPFGDPIWFHQVLHRFYQIEPVVIYCLPPIEVVMKNILQGDDNRVFHGNPQAVRQIWGAYLNKATTEHIFYNRSWIYDYTSEISRSLYPVMVQGIKGELLKKGYNG